MRESSLPAAATHENKHINQSPPWHTSPKNPALKKERAKVRDRDLTREGERGRRARRGLCRWRPDPTYSYRASGRSCRSKSEVSSERRQGSRWELGSASHHIEVEMAAMEGWIGQSIPWLGTDRRRGGVEQPSCRLVALRARQQGKQPPSRMRTPREVVLPDW